MALALDYAGYFDDDGTPYGSGPGGLASSGSFSGGDDGQGASAGDNFTPGLDTGTDPGSGASSGSWQDTGSVARPYTLADDVDSTVGSLDPGRGTASAPFSLFGPFGLLNPNTYTSGSSTTTPLPPSLQPPGGLGSGGLRYVPYVDPSGGSLYGSNGLQDGGLLMPLRSNSNGAGVEVCKEDPYNVDPNEYLPPFGTAKGTPITPVNPPEVRGTIDRDATPENPTPGNGAYGPGGPAAPGSNSPNQSPESGATPQQPDGNSPRSDGSSSSRQPGPFTNQYPGSSCAQNWKQWYDDHPFTRDFRRWGDWRNYKEDNCPDK